MNQWNLFETIINGWDTSDQYIKDNKNKKKKRNNWANFSNYVF